MSDSRKERPEPAGPSPVPVKDIPPPPEKDDAGIVDAHRTEKRVEDLGGEID